MIRLMSACRRVSFLSVYTIIKWFIVFCRKFTDSRSCNKPRFQGQGFKVKASVCKAKGKASDSKAVDFKAKAKNFGILALKGN